MQYIIGWAVFKLQMGNNLNNSQCFYFYWFDFIIIKFMLIVFYYYLGSLKNITFVNFLIEVHSYLQWNVLSLVVERELIVLILTSTLIAENRNSHFT